MPRARGAPAKPLASRCRRRACTAGVHRPAVRRTVSPTRTTSGVAKPPVRTRSRSTGERCITRLWGRGSDEQAWGPVGAQSRVRLAAGRRRAGLGFQVLWDASRVFVASVEDQHGRPSRGVVEDMSIRLVIAEDTEHVRRMLVDILGLHGFEVVAEAGTLDEALRRVEESEPDVLVVGHRPRGIDGIEAVRRSRGRLPSPPVILYAAAIDGEVEAQAKEAGAATCISRTAGVEALARGISAITLRLDR